MEIHGTQFDSEDWETRRKKKMKTEAMSHKTQSHMVVIGLNKECHRGSTRMAKMMIVGAKLRTEVSVDAVTEVGAKEASVGQETQAKMGEMK